LLSYPITDAVLRWLEVILEERFGHKWHLSFMADGLCLQLVGAEGAILFESLCNGFTQSDSDLPFSHWDAEHEGWTSLFGGGMPAPGVPELPMPLIENRSGDYIIQYDILGLTYWMLSRVEEIARTDLDDHERFPAISSHAYKYGYLDRPVVDEWLHVLGQVIRRQWVGIELKQHNSKTLVSCDVDSPFALDGSFSRMVRRSMGDLLMRRSISALAKTVVGTWLSRHGNHSLDPYRQGIEFIMETSERAGCAVAFYFIPENTDSRLDNGVSLDDPRMRALLQEIHARGHEIGIHPGYHSYKHPETMLRSVQTLRQVLDEEGIEQPLLGGRQHFLRWETPTTARLWDENDLNYDTTLSYADRPGFRCGTCFEYPMFDAVEQRALKLRQRPLILMECSVIAKRYLGLGYSDKALWLMLEYRERCRQMGGNFTLLWHNSHFGNEEDKRFYEVLLGGYKAK